MKKLLKIVMLSWIMVVLPIGWAQAADADNGPGPGPGDATTTTTAPTTSQSQPANNNVAPNSPQSENATPDSAVPAPAAGSQSSTSATTLAPTPTVHDVHCPAIESLVKDQDKGTWSAENFRFRSFESSFDNEIASFTGAQWHGTKVGQVYCVYHGTQQNSFPIVLIFHALVLEPTDDPWGKNLGTYRNCVSTDPNACVFKVPVKKQNENIYEEAEKLKQEKSPQEPSD